MVVEFLYQLLYRETRVDNILDHHHRAAGNILLQTVQFFHLAGRLHALIRFHADKRNLGIDRNLAKQIGGKDKRTVQYAQEERVLPRQLFVHLRGYPSHRLGNLFPRYVWSEKTVLNLNFCVHWLYLNIAQSYNKSQKLR